MTEQTERERGVTLVELVIGMAMGTVVAVLATYVLINTLRTDTTVAGTTAATTRAQAVSAVIDRAVRTASGFTRISGTDLKVCFRDGTWQRFTFVPDAATGALKLQVSRTSSTPGTLAARVTDPAFSQSGRRLDYRFTIGRTSTTNGVLVDRSVVQRTPGSSPCTA